MSSKAKTVILTAIGLSTASAGFLTGFHILTFVGGVTIAKALQKDPQPER